MGSVWASNVNRQYIHILTITFLPGGKMASFALLLPVMALEAPNSSKLYADYRALRMRSMLPPACATVVGLITVMGPFGSTQWAWLIGLCVGAFLGTAIGRLGIPCQKTMATPLTSKLHRLCRAHEKRARGLVRYYDAWVDDSKESSLQTQRAFEALNEQRKKLDRWNRQYNALRRVCPESPKSYSESLDDILDSLDSDGDYSIADLTEIFRSLQAEIRTEQAKSGILPSIGEKKLVLQSH
jgi:hypothetical protein